MNLTRRNLLIGAGALAALPLIDRIAGPAFAAPQRPIGIQLYTVRDLFAADPVGTLGKIAKIGYREVEYGGGGYDKMDHAMLRKAMDRLGLKAPSIHVGYDALIGQLEATVAMAKTLGADTIVLPYMEKQHRGETEWQAAIERMNRIATDLQKADLAFAYHNHDFEFTTKPGGVSLFERLARDADPALVRFELDLYWAAHAGEDLAAWIARLGPRLYSYHVKDMRPDRSMTAVGQGTIDFAALFRLKGSAGVRHFYVENDEAPAPYLPDITTSFKTLSTLRF